MAERILTKDTLFSTMVDWFEDIIMELVQSGEEIVLGEEFNVCASTEQYIGKLLKADPNMTIEQLTEFINADESGDWNPVWVSAVVFGIKMDPEVRKPFMMSVTRPIQAFQIYLRVSDLSDEEDLFLESVFKGKLPRAEQELKDGIVVRVKDG